VVSRVTGSAFWFSVVFFNTEAQRKEGRTCPRERSQRTPVMSQITLSVLSFSVVNFYPNKKEETKTNPNQILIYLCQKKTSVRSNQLHTSD
jgi:hypothetical protein